ncbi:MAG: glycosyl transferase family 2, partial [Terriglobales bacterium]
WPRCLMFLPFLMAQGIGLTLTNTKVVLEALFGMQSPFARTPKYRVESKKDRVRTSKYRKRLGLIPYFELLVGAYFAATVWYAITNENYITVPFLFLFVLGYWYTGLMSLLQGRFERIFSGRELREPQTGKPYPVGV